MKNSGRGPSKQGESNVRTKAFRSSLLTLAGLLAAGFLLGSCGGGGATGGTQSQQGGALAVLPGTGSAYGGVPFTMTVTGGRPNYTLASSEPSLFNVPNQISGNSFTVLPANPGVIDSGLKPEDLPVRTVTIQARDASGQLASSVIKVGVNFLTGYGLSFTQTNCPQASTTQTTLNPVACAGGASILSMQATFQGNLYGNRAFTLQVLKGPFNLRNVATGQSGQTINVVSDHSGTVLAEVDVTNGAPSSVAVFRVQDTATGVYADQAFVISGAATGGTLTTVPSSISFSAALSTECGTGFSDVLILDGTPPYTAFALNPNTRVTPTTSSDKPARFTISASNKDVCLDKVPVVFTDANGASATIQVTTTPGTAAPPTVTPFTVAPTTVGPLACGQTANVSVAGGNGVGSYSANSDNPRVIAFVFNNTVGISRVNGDGTGLAYLPAGPP